MNYPIKVLFLTTEWPSIESSGNAPFLVQYAEALRDQDVSVDVYHIHGRGNPLNYLQAWFDARKQPIWSQADIIHAHWGQSAYIALFSRIPMVVTFHGSDLQGIVNSKGKYTLKGKLLVKLSHLIARKADVCIVVSERLSKLLPVCGRAPEVIPMGINLETFKPMDKLICRQALGLELHKRYLLFVSDPKRPEKRFKLAQQAFAAACLDNAELLVVYGHPYEKIPLYLNAGDLLLLTSCHEGSPVIIKEALACNLPIVAVDVGDVREKLATVAGCVVCENDNVETISQAIKQTMANNQFINGRDSVLGLSWELIAQDTLKIYHQVLSKQS